MTDADITFHGPRGYPDEDGKMELHLAQGLAAAADEFKRRCFDLVREKRDLCDDADIQELASILMKPLEEIERWADEELRKREE